MRVAFATNCVPPYRYPVFHQLSENPALTVCIFVSMPLMASCDMARAHLQLKRPLSLNVSVSTTHAEVGTRQTEVAPLPIGLLWSLLRFRPHVIISGDFGLRTFLCWLVARTIGARFLVWTEEIQASARGRSKLQRAIRRLLVPRTDGFLAWGEPARDYLTSQGVALDRISVVPQSIDVDDWNRIRPRRSRSELRTELGLSKTTFLLVGRLVERKGFDRFIKAWAALPDSLTANAAALIVGAGELRPELAALSQSLRAQSIAFVGGLPAEELAKYYAACDVLVFPSLEDVWGMVVNEALLFGMPVLGSIHAGAVQQLVRDNETGRAFDPNDLPAFTRILGEWIEHAPRLSRKDCRSVGESQSPAASARAIAARLLDQVPT